MLTQFFIDHCKSALQTKPTKSLRCCRYTNSQPSLKNSCAQLNFVLLKYAFLTMQSENNKFKHILILWPWIMKVVGNVALNNSFNYNRKILLSSKHDYILFWVSFFSNKRILTSKAQGSLKITKSSMHEKGAKWMSRVFFRFYSSNEVRKIQNDHRLSKAL